MIARHLVPEGRAGAVRFRDFTADEREMGRLFEDFVRGYLRTEHPETWGSRAQEHQVGRGARRGTASCASRSWKPTSTYRAPGGRSVIVETKCVSEPFARAGARPCTVSLRSDHLYQLFAYLTNHARSYSAEPPACRIAALRDCWGDVRLPLPRARTSAVGCGP